jgi:thiamine-phosphate pyrophosphorylase
LATPETDAHHQLHLVTTSRGGSDELVHAVALALDGGVDWVQLRDKSASAAALYAQAAQLLSVVRQHGARLAVNDRVDVALASRADAVHLAGQSLPVDAAVQLAAGRIRVGRSVHSLDEARTACAQGADYVTFGHVFPTSTHPGLPPRGLDELKAIVEAIPVPVLAIGGITAENLEAVLATGCAGVAVISAILSDSDPTRAAAQLRAALDASRHQPRTPFPAHQRGANATHHQPAAV